MGAINEQLRHFYVAPGKTPPSFCERHCLLFGLIKQSTSAGPASRLPCQRSQAKSRDPAMSAADLSSKSNPHTERKDLGED